jgi:hypothetical protein
LKQGLIITETEIFAFPHFFPVFQLFPRLLPRLGKRQEDENAFRTGANRWSWCRRITKERTRRRGKDDSMKSVKVEEA